MESKTRVELMDLCKERGIKGISGKKKEELIALLTERNVVTYETTAVPTSSTLRTVDLFAGTGAFTYAFQSTGKAQCVFANDMVDASKTFYDANFKHALTLKNLHDVTLTEIPAHDILTGGFPCQPFSIAGLQGGFEDKRSNVFWKILEILDFHKPQCVVLENVKNLVTHDNGRTFKTIQTNLESRGYHIKHKVLNTAKITGVPQHRERIYIVCFRNKALCDKFDLDFPIVPKQPISSCLETTIPPKYYYTNASTTWDLVRTGVVKKDTIYQLRRVYVRENMSGECPTLTANMGGGGHNVPLLRDNHGIRKLTPRECFNFQGFPSTFTLPPLADSHLYKLAGNAVSVPVISLIANKLVALLNA